MEAEPACVPPGPGRTRDSGRHRSALLLLVVFALWVNLDDWFFLGPALAALFWVSERLQWQRRTPGWLIPAGLAACLLVLQYDVHPFVGLSFGPITFLICVLGGLGNFVGGFVAAFVFAEIISLGGLFSDLEWGYVLAFGFFIVMMFIRPGGLLARRS